MLNEICYRQNQETATNMIAAFRQKYNEVKNLTRILLVLSVWVPIVLALTALALKSQTVTGVLGISPLDLSLYVSFYCVVIALLDLALLSKTIDSGKELAAKLQELFDTHVFGMRWNETMVGAKPDFEQVFRLKSHFFRSAKNTQEDLLNWYNPKVSSVGHDKGVLLCQRMNLSWDTSLRKKVNDRVFLSTICWSLFIVALSLNQDLSLRTLLLSVVCPLLPILVYTIKLISDNKKSISATNKLKEQLDSVWRDATHGTLTSEKLREVQNEIYLHRKSNRPISNKFYFKRKDDFEEDAQYSIERLIEELDEREQNH